jgi:secreted PhoX family phosphatase
MDRRQFLRAGLLGSAGLALGPTFWRAAYSAPAQPGIGPYGPLLAPDPNGLALPAGFTSRVVAVSGLPVAATAHQWHGAPDGGATYPTADGGWIYVSNSEIPFPLGGAGAIKFGPDGTIVDSYRILTGTDSNCAGGPTPWGTWLSCEESLSQEGHVWECDPTQLGQGTERPAMGTFAHEAAAVDPVHKHVYLTEDKPDSRFYRFTPTTYPDLSAGTLEAASVAGDGAVTWVAVDAATVAPRPAGTTAFDGGEGCWYDSGHIYFTTKGDNRVWDLDAAAQRLSVVYDAEMIGPDAPLTGVDNIVASSYGDLYVAEDGGDLDIVVITKEREVAKVVHVANQQGGGIEDGGTELAGPAFDPSGRRLYFSSQRATLGGLPGPGITYEVTGPFRVALPVALAQTTTTSAPAAAGADAARGQTLPATGLGRRTGLAGAGLLGAAALASRLAREDGGSVTPE